MLPNGNILFHDTWTTLKEITLDKKVVWEYDCANSNGNKGKRVDGMPLPDCLMETPALGSKVGRAIEVDRGANCPLLPRSNRGGPPVRAGPGQRPGNLFVCSATKVVTEYDERMEKWWDYLIKTRLPCV